MAGVKLYNNTGDEKAVRTQEAIEKKFGFIPEVFQAMGRNGDFLQAAMHIADVAGQGLDAKTRELIIIAVPTVWTLTAPRRSPPASPTRRLPPQSRSPRRSAFTTTSTRRSASILTSRPAERGERESIRAFSGNSGSARYILIWFLTPLLPGGRSCVGVVLDRGAV